MERFRMVIHIAVLVMLMALTAWTSTLAEDDSWGTRDNKAKPYIENSEQGSSWGTIPPEPEEQPDPYDQIIITVDPDVKWPPSGSETTSTTTVHTTDNATQDANSTDSTTTTNTW